MHTLHRQLTEIGAHHGYFQDEIFFKPTNPQNNEGEVDVVC
jgi:hypothetical protein